MASSHGDHTGASDDQLDAPESVDGASVDAHHATSEPHSRAEADATTEVERHTSATDQATVYAWAPESDDSPAKRKRRWPWIALPLAGVTAGLVIASLTLIAPGVSAAGVPVGGLTPSAAETAITQRIAAAEVTLKTEHGPITVTGADLGASVDAKSLAEKAFAEAPAWRVVSWGSDQAPASITLDDEKAMAVLRASMPKSYVDPVDAVVTFDEAAASYIVEPAVAGTGIALDTVRSALELALETDDDTATVTAEVEEVPALLSTEAAALAAAELNALVTDVGFYVGDERTVPVPPATAASWITPTINNDGTVTIEASEAKIGEFTKTLAEKVNRDAVDGVWIVDRQGNQLFDSIATKEGVEGRTVGDTSMIARSFATQLETREGHFALTVITVQPQLTKLERWIEVDISDQVVYAWENGEVARTMLTSSGLSPNDSERGTFRINSHVTLQDMGCVPGYDYCTKDVPWVMYYNGDEAFHGTWWHSSFGTPQSHGCLNLSVENSRWLWDWTPLGTEVWVHD